MTVVNESRANLLTALLAFQAEAKKLNLGRDSSGQVAGNRHYKYLSLDKLTDEVAPLLAKHGLVWQTFPTILNGGDPALRYRLSHAPTGEFQEDTMPLMLEKPTSQQFGSGQTYGRRYSLSAVLNLVADPDDDGQEASKPRRPPAPIRPVADSDRLMTPEELEILGKAVGESGQKLSLLLASVGAEDLDALTVAQGRDVMRKLSGSRK